MRHEWFAREVVAAIRVVEDIARPPFPYSRTQYTPDRLENARLKQLSMRVEAAGASGSQPETTSAQESHHKIDEKVTSSREVLLERDEDSR